MAQIQKKIFFFRVSFPENDNFFPSLSRKIPQRLKDLIKLLLSRNKKNRPSCDEILQSVGDIRTTFTSTVYNETPDVSMNHLQFKSKFNN